MRKVFDTIATILFAFAAIVGSVAVAGFAAWLSTVALSVVAEIFLGWDISSTGGTIIAVIIAACMLVSFWGKLLFTKKKK